MVSQSTGTTSGCGLETKVQWRHYQNWSLIRLVIRCHFGVFGQLGRRLELQAVTGPIGSGIRTDPWSNGQSRIDHRDTKLDLGSGVVSCGILTTITLDESRLVKSSWTPAHCLQRSATSGQELMRKIRALRPAYTLLQVLLIRVLK